MARLGRQFRERERFLRFETLESRRCLADLEIVQLLSCCLS